MPLFRLYRILETAILAVAACDVTAERHSPVRGASAAHAKSRANVLLTTKHRRRNQSIVDTALKQSGTTLAASTEGAS